MTATDITAVGPGTILAGRYTVVGTLGAGGMGTVFLATDSTLAGRKVAVKVLTVPDADGQFLRRFRREAQVMARLRHPNVVEVYDVDLSASPPLIVLEYVEGEDLHSLACQGELLDGSPLRRLALELAEALAYLHASGVIHRDVKSGNVMLQPDGRARLMDLGLAHDAGATKLTADDCFMGTVVAVPPEVILGAPHSPCSDVFAWAIVVYRAATGCHPYMARDDANGYVQMVSRGHFPPVPDHPAIPEELMAVVRSCLAYDAAERPADGTALLAVLRQGTNVTTSSPAIHPPTQRPPTVTASGPHAVTQVTDSAVTAAVPSTRRRRGPLAALALLVLVGAGLLAVRPATTSPPEALSPSIPSIPPPRVRCSLDRVELSLPTDAPADCLGRLMDATGELVVERPFREGRCLLAPPQALRQTPLTWAVSAPGRRPVTGPALVGLRLVFDALPPDPARPAGAPYAMRLPPVVVGHRILHALSPDCLAVFRRSPTPATGLTLETVLRQRPRPLRFRTAEGLPPRYEHSLVALTALGARSALVVGHGLGARWSMVRSGTGAPDGPLDLLDLAPATAPAVELVDALVVSLPGGRALAALDCLAPPGTPEPRRSVELWRIAPTAAEPLTRLAAFPGRTPLTLTATGGDSALLLHAEGETIVARQLSVDAPAGAASRSWTMPELGEAPAWRDQADASAVCLTASRVLATLQGSLVAVDLPSGPPRLLPSPLPRSSRPLNLLPLGEGCVLVVGSRPAAPPITIPSVLDLVVVDADGLAVGGSPPPLAVDTQIRLVPPVALLATPDRLVLGAYRRAFEFDPLHPGSGPRSGVELAEGWLSAALMLDDLVCLFDRKGQIFAYDTVEDDD